LFPNQFERAEDPLFRNGIALAGANKTWFGETPVPGREDGVLTAYEPKAVDSTDNALYE